MARREIHTLNYTAAEIDDILRRADEHPFVLYHDKEMGLYRIFANEETRDLWLSDNIANKELELYNFIAPAPYTMYVEAIGDTTRYFLLGDDNITINYNYITRNSSDIEKAEGVDVTYEFNRDGNVTTRTVGYNKPQDISYNISEFLSVAGDYFVTVTVTGRTTGAQAHISFEYHIVDLELTSTFNIAKEWKLTENILIPYESRGPIGSIIEIFIDGSLFASHATASNPENDTMSIPNTFGVGGHSLLMRSHIVTPAGEDFYSKSLYYEFTTEGDGQFISISLLLDDNTVIFADKSNLILPAEQYNTTNIQWSYYGSPIQDTSISWKLNGEVVKLASVESTATEPYILEFMPSVSGDYSLDAYDGETRIAAYKIKIVPNAKGIEESTKDITLKLSAQGRDNNELPSPATWDYKDIHTTFHDIAWTKTQGWINNTLYLSRGAWIEIDHTPFARTPENFGMTFEIEFEVTDVYDENAVLMDLGSNNLNITILGNRAIFSNNADTGASINTQFPQNERIKLAFVIHNATSYDSKLMYIVNNSIPDRVCKYSNVGSGLATKDKIVIGNKEGKASIKIYNIRCYERAISFDEEFYNFIIDNGIVNTKMNENDIYTEGTSNVSVEKMKSKLPVMLVTGDIEKLLASTSKNIKVNMSRVEFFNCDDSSKNFTIVGPRMKLQGTSSLTYPRKNFKLYSAKDGAIMYDAAGNVIINGLYAFYNGDIPVDTWTLKADFSDSSCTHNATVARLYGDVEVRAGMTTPPQKIATSYKSLTGSDFPYHQDNNVNNPIAIRTTPNAIPMVMFYRQTDKEDYIFMGQYTMLNDKSNEYVYGFHSIYNNGNDPFLLNMTKAERNALKEKLRAEGKMLYDNADCHCYEVLNNSGDDFGEYSLFKTNDGFYTPQGEANKGGVVPPRWCKAFESRYPEVDDEEDTFEDYCKAGAPMYSFINWVKSLMRADGTLDQDKFGREAADHLDLKMCAAYYTYLMRFGAVDQVQKNMMWTTYGERSKSTVPSGLTWSDDPSLREIEHDSWNLIWFPIKYDNDTILGVTNTGQLRYDYTIDRRTLDTAAGVDTYAYAGHDSLLWNVLEASNDFMKTVKEVDQELYQAGISYNNVIHYFDDLVSDRWCERVYTLNERYKYVSPWIDGVADEMGEIKHESSYLTYMQGKRQSHRHWWIGNRFDRYDAMWTNGAYNNKEMIGKFATPGAKEIRDEQGNVTIEGEAHPFTLRFKTAVPYYYGWALDKNIVESGVERSPIDEYGGWYEITRQSSVIGSPIHIYGINQVEEIDISDATPYMQNVMTINTGSDTDNKLKKLVIGNADPKKYNRAADFNLSGYENITSLEYFDCRGICGNVVEGQLKFVFTPQLTKLYNLNTFLAGGSVISSFEPAVGASFKRIELPDTITSIRMNENVWDRFDYTPTNTLQLMNLQNMKNHASVQKLVFDWYKNLLSDPNAKWDNKVININKVDWSNVKADEIIDMKNRFGEGFNITGGISLAKDGDIDILINKIKAAFGENAFVETSALHFYINDLIIFDIPDSIDEGNEVKLNYLNYSKTKEGTVTYSINSVMFVEDEFKNNILKTMILEKDREYEFTVKFTSADGKVITVSKNLMVKGRIYPHEVFIVSIDGDNENFIASTMTKTYEYRYPAGLRVTGEVTDKKWTLSSDDDYINDYIMVDNDKSIGPAQIKLKVINVPEEVISCKLTINLTFDNGSKLQADQIINIHPYTWPKYAKWDSTEPFVINDLPDSGYVDYYVTFLPDNNFNGVYTNKFDVVVSGIPANDIDSYLTYEELKDKIGMRIYVNKIPTGSDKIEVSLKYTMVDGKGADRVESNSAVVQIFSDIPVVTHDSNPVVMMTLYRNGWCKKNNWAYKSELANVTDDDFIKASNKNNNSLSFAAASKELGGSTYKEYSFNEFEYFTGITTIPAGMWHDNGNTLTSITFPKSIKTIAASAFQGAYSLKTVKLNEGLEEIDYSFFYTSGIKSIDLPSTLKSIYANTFNSSGIEEIRCFALNAPRINNSESGTLNKTPGTLYVPRESTGYTDEWKKDFGISNWTIEYTL